MIEESYVSFDTAKMLKDVGFDVPCISQYMQNGFRWNGGSYKKVNSNEYESVFSCPTQALAARWLREVHGIVVDVTLIPPLNDRIMKSKQVLDVQQMQHLQELGIRMELYTTLFCYVKFEDTDWLLKPISDLSTIGISFYAIPAYTLQDVLDALPATIEHGGKLYMLMIDMLNRTIHYFRYTEVLTFVKFKEIPFIDAAYNLLCWAIEQGYVETNKNK